MFPAQPLNLNDVNVPIVYCYSYVENKDPYYYLTRTGLVIHYNWTLKQKKVCADAECKPKTADVLSYKEKKILFILDNDGNVYRNEVFVSHNSFVVLALIYC